MIVVTNRLPDPPIGGIPRFLSELALAAQNLFDHVSFLIPNRTEALVGERPQTKIESILAGLPALRDVPLSNTEVRRSVESVGARLIDYKITTRTSPQPVVVAPSLVAFTDDRFCERASAALRHAHQVGKSSTLLLLAPIEELDFYLGGELVRDLVGRISSVGRHASCLAAPSLHSASGWQQRLALPVTRLPLGIGPSAVADQPRQRHRHRYISCERPGPFAMHKNTWLLERVYSLLSADAPVEMVIVGGHKSNSDRMLATPPELADKELQHLFETSRAFLSLSAFESFGFAGLEAMRGGAIPIVRSGTGLTETVSDIGIALDADNDLALCEQAADAVLAVINENDSSFEEMSRRARERATRLSGVRMYRSLAGLPTETQ